MDYDGGLSIYGTAQTAVDPQCVGKPWRDKEIPSKRGCGLGFEAALAVAWLARRQIGGQTGDVLGAGQQMAEVLCLAALIAVG